MTDVELTDFRRWAEALASGGFVQARWALALLAELDRLRAFTDSLAERCAGQAEVLAGRAERPAKPWWELVQ